MLHKFLSLNFILKLFQNIVKNVLEKLCCGGLLDFYNLIFVIVSQAGIEDNLTLVVVFHYNIK